MGPKDRAADTLITVQEIRHIHHLPLTLIWQVSPHPDASDIESPGNFRRHDIHPFEEGMTPRRGRWCPPPSTSGSLPSTRCPPDWKPAATYPNCWPRPTITSNGSTVP